MWKSKCWACVFAAVGALVFGAEVGGAAEGAPSGSGLAEAPMWWLGFQLHAVTDGGAPTFAENTEEAYSSLDSTHFDWGGGFTIPLTVNFYRGLGMRTAFSATYSGDPPFDDALTQIPFLQKQDSGAWGNRQYGTRPAFFAGFGLLFDVHYMFPLLFGAIKPYLGAGPGLYFNYIFTDIFEDDFELLNNEYNDPADDNNIDPYSVNVEPGFNGYLGLNFMVSGGMHLNFEVQYDLARMDEVKLLKATDQADARRAAYTFSTITISSGLLFNF